MLPAGSSLLGGCRLSARGGPGKGKSPRELNRAELNFKVSESMTRSRDAWRGRSESGARLCLGCRQGRQRERDTKYIRVRPTQGGTEKLKKRRLDKYWSRMAKVLL